MYENVYSKEKQELSNGSAKFQKNHFTKSLTSFSTKKSFAKNIIIQNPLKKSTCINQEKSVKNKKIYLSR